MNSRSVGATFGLDKADLFIKGLRFGDYFSFDYNKNKIIDTTKTHCRNWFACDTANKNVGELSSMGLPRLRTIDAYNFNDLLNLDYELFKKQFIYWNTLFRYYKENPEDDYGSEAVGFNIAGFPGKRISVTSGLSLENSFWKFQNMIGFKIHYMKAEISKGTYSALVEPTIEKTDYHDYAYDESLSFNVVEPLTLKASYQHSVRLPTPDELFGDGAGIGAAPGLKPEESDNINAGFSLDLQEFPLVARLRLDADAFYTYYKNRIHYMSSAQMSVPYFNMNPIRGWGYEGDVKLDVNEWVLLGANWTFQDLRNIDYNAKQGIPKDAIIPNIPRFFMNFLAEFHMGDILNKNDFVKFWWAANYTDEYYYGWRVSSRQSRKIEASFSQDLGIEYSVWDNKLAWSFEVDNFMDGTVYDKYGESKPGRTFATKIRYSFR
jgi:outer membrane receptor protein involved in Fe transport